jgi:molybdate transport system substrate-binding protein
MGKRIKQSLLALLLATAAGCAPGEQASDEPPELVVSAAASLTLPLEEIKANYEAAAPGTKLVVNYGSTGGLQKQIEMGMPTDVFLAAGARPMEQLLEAGWIDSELHATLLTNRLVAVVPLDRETAPGRLEDLADDAWGRIAVGVPETVPAGGYAKEALESVGLWDEVFAKAVFGKDVRQVLTAVETGNADAGFVYATDAIASTDVRVAFEVSSERHRPIVYPVGVVGTTEYPSEAEAFYRYLLSDEAKAVFEKYGFGAAAEQP